MKIALTSDPEIPVPPVFYGGIERIIYMLVVELVNAGHDVTLFAHKDSVVPCSLVAYPGKTNKKSDIIKNSWTIWKYSLIEKFDIIHSFGRLAYLLPLMPANIPILMSYQREPTIKMVKKAVKLSKKGTIAFTGCSNYISNQIKPYATVATVYNSAAISDYTATIQIEPDAPLVFLGRIEPIKGVHNAIDIAIKSKKRLVIAGNIPLGAQKYFDEQIAPFLGSDIIYIGAVNDEQKNKLLGIALAFLMPIEWNEPFGIVMIEAMACGTPVIGINRGAVPEVIDQGKTGFYGHTTDELVAYVEHIPSLSRTTVRKEFEERFSSKVIADNYLLLYRQLIKE